MRTGGDQPRRRPWQRGKERWLPLYEAKMAHHFNHRFGDYVLKTVVNDSNQLPDTPLALLQDPTYVVQPRYWVAETEVRAAMRDPEAGWLLGFRDICRSTDERTMIAQAVPLAACGHKLPILNVSDRRTQADLACVLGSFVQDFAARQKVGGTNMAFFSLKQLPVLRPEVLKLAPPWAGRSVSAWLRLRLLELSFTAVDLQGLADDLGFKGVPFRWDPARRELLRAELDAAFFRLYGITRDDVDYIMDTFPIVRRKDEAAHGEYRTKRLILERYDALAECIANGTEYQTVLEPPPAHPSLAHPESTRPDWA